MSTFISIIQAVFALAITLGLVGLAAYAARRWGPAGLLMVRRPEERRLQIVESMNLDPQRRVVLIRVDAEERLLLLGEGRMLTAPTTPKAAPPPAPPPVAIKPVAAKPIAAKPARARTVSKAR